MTDKIATTLFVLAALLFLTAVVFFILTWRNSSWRNVIIAVTTLVLSSVAMYFAMQRAQSVEIFNTDDAVVLPSHMLPEQAG
ncbi:MAG TPA: hypothetical protein VLH86_06070 [Patescibacteria group bacterium]|nr:hypothetical protein [Patescibacteria group bacterium]